MHVFFVRRPRNFPDKNGGNPVDLHPILEMERVSRIAGIMPGAYLCSVFLQSTPGWEGYIGIWAGKMSSFRGFVVVVRKKGGIWWNYRTTVDGRYPKQPPDMYEALQVVGYLPYQLVQDFFHQQY